MTKYDIILFAQQRDDFLDKLQDLGLVDITTTGWEPNEEERDLMISIERHRAAVSRLREMAKAEDFTPGRPYENGGEAYEKYLEATRELDDLDAQIALAEKEAGDYRAWGSFDPQRLADLRDGGIVLRFFTTNKRELDTNINEWSQRYNIERINDLDGISYFVVITRLDEDVEINAQEVRPPTAPAKEKVAEAHRLEKDKEPWNKQLARAAASVDMIEEHGEAETERLHLSKASGMAAEQADGSLIVMEGWATKESSQSVDRMLEEYPNVLYLKSRPTPKDDTPTMLKNSKFNSMFEIIGSFYSQPKYDTMDLTKWFGPFYALFFGLCLADAGYGLIYFILGIVMRFKLKAEMKPLANLVTLLGFSTMICGTLMDSFFGMKLTGWAPLSGLQDYLIGDHMFIIALALGVVQILVAMCLKVYMYAHKYGLKYALSTIGWMLVLITVLPTLADMLDVNVPASLLSWSPAGTGLVKIVMLCVGMLMMLFLNSPGKNPLVNFGSGLWNLYNDLVGFISDFLSYIRLFAIGLSGGILASVFNMLAIGLSGDIPVLKQIFMVVILLIGHGLTIFMSTISAFVHPMRLTFVEFYKNSGFEDTQRIFEPLKRNRKK